MKTYLFRTTTTENKDDFWIDRNIVRDIEIQAESLKAALEDYYTYVTDECYIEISKSARKNKSPMYRDTENGTQKVGYVIVGSTEIEFNYHWKKRHVSLWVEIKELNIPEELAC